MKTRRMIFLMVLAVLIMAACEKDDTKNLIPEEEGSLTTVNFEMDANAFGHNGITRAIVPVYTNAGFNIFAFRKADDGSDYRCNQVIYGSTMDYNVATGKLTGSARLPIGTYRFVPAYGLVSPLNVEMPDMTNAELSDMLGVTHKNTGSVPEIFLAAGTSSTLPSYVLGTTSAENPTISASLKRAVARVDVLFLKATKTGEIYKEEPYADGEDVFGGKELDTVQLRFTSLNDKMSLLGSRIGTGTLDADINIPRLTDAVVKGEGTATVIGTSDFTRYDAIGKGDIIKGSAHLAGPYVFPGNDDTKNTGLEIYIKPKNSIGRTITIDTKLPLERNKVTLVKVYVLEGNVFTTKVTFEVRIDTAWNGSHEVSGEVD